MAFKVAFIAALCVAQACAFHLTEKAKGSEYEVFVHCFEKEGEHVQILGMKMNDGPRHAVSLLKGEVKELATKYLRRIEEPVVKINKHLLQGYNNVLTQLEKRNFPAAGEYLGEGVKGVVQSFVTVEKTLHKIAEEVPQLEDVMKYVFRYLVFQMEVFFPRMGMSFGSCMLNGNTDIFY